MTREREGESDTANDRLSDAYHESVGSVVAARTLHEQACADEGPEGATITLCSVVLEHVEECFRDTDGITRDAARMLEIMARWRPNLSDREAGMQRNRAFDPNLGVVVTDDLRIRCPPGAAFPGEPSLLFTIVPRDRGRAVRAPDAG